MWWWWVPRPPSNFMDVPHIGVQGVASKVALPLGKTCASKFVDIQSAGSYV